MKSTTEIISELARNREVEKIIRNLAPPNEDRLNLQDLAQDIYETLLTKDCIEIQDIYNKGEMNYYLVSLVRNNIFSETSRYYYKYKKHKRAELNIIGNNQYGQEEEND